MASNTSRPEGMRLISATTFDTTNKASTLDYFDKSRGLAYFRSIEAGEGINLELVDNNGKPSEKGNIIRLTANSSGGLSDIVGINPDMNTVKIDGATPVNIVFHPTQGALKIDSSTPIAVSTGGLTDTQLRATAIPVSISSVVGGSLDVAITAPVDVVGPVTDTQLRATPLSVQVSNTTPVDVNLVSGHFRPLPKGINRSGTITTANQWQVVSAENAARTSLSLQALTEDVELYVTEFETAGLGPDSPGVYRLQSGQVFWALSSNEINVYATVAGAKFTSTETEYE